MEGPTLFDPSWNLGHCPSIEAPNVADEGGAKLEHVLYEGDRGGEEGSEEGGRSEEGGEGGQKKGGGGGEGEGVRTKGGACRGGRGGGGGGMGTCYEGGSRGGGGGRGVCLERLGLLNAQQCMLVRHLKKEKRKALCGDKFQVGGVSTQICSFFRSSPSSTRARAPSGRRCQTQSAVRRRAPRSPRCGIARKQETKK